MAVIFHLTNHYALVFATRERSTVDTDGSATITRELLTSKAGQAPKTWIPFAVARRMPRGWSGYKMVVVMRATECETFRDTDHVMAEEERRSVATAGPSLHVEPHQPPITSSAIRIEVRRSARTCRETVRSSQNPPPKGSEHSLASSPGQEAALGQHRRVEPPREEIAAAQRIRASPVADRFRKARPLRLRLGIVGRFTLSPQRLSQQHDLARVLRALATAVEHRVPARQRASCARHARASRVAARSSAMSSQPETTAGRDSLLVKRVGAA